MASTSIQERRAFFGCCMNTLAARSVVARFAVAKGEHLFVGRMGGPDLGAGRTDLTGTPKDLRLWEPCKELEIGH